jgi:hypothetical protein
VAERAWTYGGQFKATVLQYLPIVVHITGILFKSLFFFKFYLCRLQWTTKNHVKEEWIMYTDLHLHTCKRYDPLINKCSKHRTTRELRISCICMQWHADFQWAAVYSWTREGGPWPRLAPTTLRQCQAPMILLGWSWTAGGTRQTRRKCKDVLPPSLIKCRFLFLCSQVWLDLYKMRATFVSLNKFIKKLDSKIFPIILIIYHKY